ncbi:unnamed protein product [Adineta ricciae]|uniref:FYVE-type domain-containing protein n=1 Tax=Adineta ricciae TaxID=249248 RepID=A0A814BKX0_ADIRI|nr:unnamed protein product [Adineta ricciae]
MTETRDFSQLPDDIKEYISTLQNDNKRYVDEVQALQTQLNNITAVVDFADSTKIAEIADLKQRHQQELATINILMEETIRDRIGDARGKYDNELNNLRRKYEVLQQENYELKSKVMDEKDSVIATISRSLRDKLTSNQSTLAQENENLEEDMRKAQESTLMLKSVIIPLEAEINQLKSQLKDAKDKIVELETLPREVKISFPSNEQDNQELSKDAPSDEQQSTTNDATSSLSSYELAIVRLNAYCSKLKDQIQEVTMKLNESQTAEKHASDERDKYIQIYARTHDRFLAFEKKQLEQMRRLLTILTYDQLKVLTESCTSQSQQSDNSSSALATANDNAELDAARHHKTEADWDELLLQISQVMDLSQKFCDKCSQQRDENNKLLLLNTQKQEENVKLLFDLSLAKAEHEKEQQIRLQLEKQLSETNTISEQLSILKTKADKNDVDFRDMKSHYDNLFAEQVNNIKKLVKERELLHLYIQRLEAENTSLAAITNDNETAKLLTYSSQAPTTFEDAWGLIVKLREEIIQQLKIKEKLKNDIQQLQYNHKADIREREQIEHLLNRDLNAAKDEIIVLQSLQTEYERVMSLKKDLEKQLDERANELKTTKAVANSFTNQLKEKLEQITSAKAHLDEENAALRVQIQKLKVDLENNELVQHDFVKLSQSLQVELEEIRNSEHQLRWQPEEDYSECQRCHSQFSVTWRKHHCRHCGKVLCKDCTNKTIYTGPNNRSSRVCDVCYTLLVKDSQPYFHSSVPDI